MPPLEQESASLVDGEQRDGYYEKVFESNDLTSGGYLYTITQEDCTATKNLILLKQTAPTVFARASQSPT